MYSPGRPHHNRLLATLPAEEMDRLLPNLELVTLQPGQVMSDSGQTLTHAYFPTTAIVSLVYVMENGDSAEIAVIGNDGVVGISLFLGGGPHTRHHRGSQRGAGVSLAIAPPGDGV